MSGGKASLAVDPHLRELQQLEEEEGDARLLYHSRIFCLTRSGAGDADEYHQLMNQLFDPSVEHLMALPGREPSKSWTREGDLMIFLEWLEVEETEEEQSADDMRF
jgi:hypothetical protein